MNLYHLAKMFVHTPKVALLLLSLMCLVNTSTAQSKLDSIYELDEFVVEESQVVKEIIPVQSLSGKELEKLSAHSVADALRYFSGVQVKDYGGIGGLKTVNVRSLGSEHVGVFYDGVEIGNAQNGVVDLGRFSLDNMEILSLYNGQKSAIFQSAKDYASASSIYMTAKAPLFRDRKNYNIKATFKTGAFDLLSPAILWEQRISDKVSSAFSADYIYSSGKYRFTQKVKNSIDSRGGYDTTMVRRNGEINMFRIEHGLFGKIDGGEWKTRTYLYSSDRGLPGAVVREEPGRFKNEDHQWDKNFFVQTSIKKRFSDTYSTELKGKYGYDYMRYLSDPEKDEQVFIYINNKYRLHEAYLSSANLFRITHFWNINLSADYQWNKLNANLTDFVYPVRHTGWMAAASSFSFSRVRLQASLLGTFANEAYDENVYDSDNNYQGRAEVKKKWRRYTPSLIGSYQPWANKDLHIRAFYKKIFRLPTFNEIYYTILGSGKSLIKPEYTTQYNLGGSYAKNYRNSFLSRIEGQMDVYYNQVDNKIVALPSGNPGRWSITNIGLVKIKGVETSLTGGLRWSRDLRSNVRLTYTYQKAQDYTYSELGSNGEHDVTYEGQIPYIPWHSGSAIVSTNYKTWDFNYSFIYTGERYISSANIEVNKEPAWYTHDLALTKSVKWQGRDFRLTAEVNNLFNQQYDVIRNYPMPGTNFKFIVSINL